MITVIEDFLCDTISEKLGILQSNPNLLDGIINTTPSSLSRFKTFIAKNNIKVIKGYPRTPAELPCISVILSGDEETQDTLGNYELYDDGIPMLDSQFENNYRMEIWANNADLVVQIYYVCKWIFLSSRDELVQNVGLYQQRIGGADFQPAPNWFPEFVYRRAMTFWCQNSVSAPTGDELENISDIQVNQTIVDDGGV